MLPLFKSHYSVGKSILTTSPPDKTQKGGPSSIFDIAQKNNLSEVILVEDSLVGFLESKKVADALGIQLIFGLRLSVCDDMHKEVKKGSVECSHKIIIFAKDSLGCGLLNKIYSCAFSTGSGSIDFTHLKQLYNPQHLKIAIPFYDSFLFHNLFSYKEPCLLDESFFDPVYFIEDNGLPQDVPTLQAVKSHCSVYSHPIEKVKSIYYENREDFEAYQTYKCICGRGFSSKAKTLDMPNLDHCGSPEFCFESYIENESH
jgi:DNA polymerase III alpha subunit